MDLWFQFFTYAKKKLQREQISPSGIKFDPTAQHKYGFECKNSGWFIGKYMYSTC